MQSVEEAKELLGVKQDKAFAKLLGVEQSTVSTWKQRGIPDAQQLRILRLAKSDMIEGAKPVRRVPVLGSVPAGFPIPTMPIVAEEVTEWVYRSDLPDGAFALRVEGDSMPPLQTGDYVAFVANGDYHDKDRVVVANEYGDPIVKRLRIKPDGCQMLVSDNPKYEPIQPNESYRIIGKVIKAWRELI